MWEDKKWIQTKYANQMPSQYNPHLVLPTTILYVCFYYQWYVGCIHQYLFTKAAKVKIQIWF